MSFLRGENVQNCIVLSRGRFLGLVGGGGGGGSWLKILDFP